MTPLVRMILVVALAVAGAGAQQPAEPKADKPAEAKPPSKEDADLQRELREMLDAVRANRAARSARAPSARSKLRLAVTGWRDLLERGDRVPESVTRHALAVLGALALDGESAASRAMLGPAVEALSKCHAARPRGYSRLVARSLSRIALLDDPREKAAFLARGLVACLVGADPPRVRRIAEGLGHLGSAARFFLPTIERIASTIAPESARELERAVAAIRRAPREEGARPPLDVFEATVIRVDPAQGVVVLETKPLPALEVGVPFLLTDGERITAVGVIDEVRAKEALGAILSSEGPEAVRAGQTAISL